MRPVALPCKKSTLICACVEKSIAQNKMRFYFASTLTKKSANGMLLACYCCKHTFYAKIMNFRQSRRYREEREVLFFGLRYDWRFFFT